MSNPSKVTKSSSTDFDRPNFRPTANYFKLLDLDLNDINSDYYNIVEKELIEKVVEAQAKKRCPPDAEYIVLSDSDEETEVNTLQSPIETVNVPQLPSPTPEPVVITENDSVEPKEPEPSQEVMESTYDEDDDLPLSKLVDKIQTSESEDEAENEFQKKDWCICKDSHVTKNLKMCDQCSQWYHVDCVGDESTRQKVLAGRKLSLIDFKCLICRNDQEMMKKFDSKLVEQRKKLAEKRFGRSSQSDSSSDSEKNRPRIRTLAEELENYSNSSDEEETKKKKIVPKKTYEEKKDAIKERLKEQHQTKLLAPGESNDKSRQLAKSRQHLISSEKASPKPKPVGQKIIVQERKKIETLNKPTLSKSKISITPSVTKKTVEIVKSKPSPVPERKTKLIQTPTSSKQIVQTIKKISNVNSSREEIKNGLLKTFNERMINSDVKIPLSELENLCSKIEQEMYNVYQSSNEYTNRCKILRLNLSDKNNKSFFRKLLKGVIKPEQLPKMDKNEMKDDDLRRQDEQLRKQDIAGRIQLSNQFNEELLKKQEALRLRKGIDDDLSTLGNFAQTEETIDVNNNKNSKPDESPLEAVIQNIVPIDTTNEHGNHQFDLACKICLGAIPAPVKKVNITQSHPVNERKRKHDSDFESDTEMDSQPRLNKIPTSKQFEVKITPEIVRPIIKYSPPVISPVQPQVQQTEMKISDQVWSGNLNLLTSECRMQIRTKIKCINDLTNSSSLIRKDLTNFKQALSGIKDLNISKKNSPLGNVWHDTSLNLNEILVIKFEAITTEKSQFQPPFIKTMKQFESQEVLDSLFEMIHLKNTSNSNINACTYTVELPKSLSQIYDKLLLVPLRKSEKSDPILNDTILREKYSILTNRSKDSILGFLVPLKNDDKKQSPEPESTKSVKISPPQGKNQARDPRNRKQQEKASIQEVEGQVTNFLKVVLDEVKEQTNQINDELNKEILANIPLIQSSEQNNDSQKVISIDLYKMKRKKVNDEHVEEPMVVDNVQPVQETLPPTTLDNFFVVDFTLSSIAKQIPLQEENKTVIFDNFKEMDALKGLTMEEKITIKNKFEANLPEFVGLLFNDNKNVETDKKSELYDPFEPDSMEEVSSNSSSSKTSDKMPLPPKNEWQGPDKESFINLLKVHKQAKERKLNGLSHDLSFENKNWDLNDKSFRKLDPNLLGCSKDLSKEKRIDNDHSDIEKENDSDSSLYDRKRKSRQSDSDSSSSARNSDEARQRYEPPRQKSYARKSCSGINGIIPRFKVRSDRYTDDDSDSDRYYKSSRRHDSKRYDSKHYRSKY